jgi:hypothetical protein
MAFKVQVNNAPEEFKVIEAAIRAAVGEQLERHAHIAMGVVPHANISMDGVLRPFDDVPYERSPLRNPVKYTLEIKVEVDITDVPLTIKEDK